MCFVGASVKGKRKSNSGCCVLEICFTHIMTQLYGIKIKLVLMEEFEFDFKILAEDNFEPKTLGFSAIIGV